MNLAKPRRPLLRRRSIWTAAAVVAVALVAAALVFEPWKLVVDQRVDEAVPTVSAAPAVPGGVAAPAVTAEPTVLASGILVSHEHESSGSAELLLLADGSRVLRLQDLRTSNGPLLRVWLTDAPVLTGSAGWKVFDDGRYVDLGDLKGNIGSSNYPIPADVDLAGLSSVSIWCARFHVSFAAAQLDPTS